MSDDKKQGGDDAAMDDWAAALAEQAQSDGETGSSAGADKGKGKGAGDEQVKKASFDNITSEPVKGATQEDVNLDVVLDIPVTISMEIGRTRLPIRNLLQLNQGSVVELDRLAGEPLDVFVNGTLIAHGEVVVVNEKFGIRLTDVISPSERVKKLK
ncbi:flagellar motor switch protein FliN [Thioalkalivibrio denitrificans]|uniref:Flagellar motor switch protein FliN n=1 Tax=Thioalkalivibrio denitrificans TaxID=108003 RepID=A0A1V3NMS5_9GAMM|nr:flagellar motor switch protein FliN [Thioalkalivibrio denitrificans]OOG26198.1 flagellar motor switch protein FliN [Thioalkalivibrio denitrificans]